MNKSKETIQIILKYLRELSIIVAGVSITVGVGLWVNSNNNAKDQKQYFDAIILELNENILILDEQAMFLEDWDRYGKYLRRHDKNSLHADSIRGIDYPLLGSIHNVVFHTSAFEMYKGSGSMRLLSDKELLQSLWKAYKGLELVKISLDTYNQLKKEEAMKANQLFLAGVHIPVPLYDFFYSYANFGAAQSCRSSSVHLKEVVTKLEMNNKGNPKK